MLKFIIPLLVLTAAAPALAEDEPVSARISLADLDLSTPEGRKTANGRVRKAARSLCSPGLFVSPTQRLQAQACARKAHASAKPAILAAVQRAKSERTSGTVLAGR
jgi:UrcA family protein